MTIYVMPDENTPSKIIELTHPMRVGGRAASEAAGHRAA
jgi:hypothetical protein